MQTNPKLRFKDKNGNSYPDWEENSMEYFGTFFKGNNLSKSDLTKNGYPCILYGELYTKYSEITKKILSYTNRLETNQIIGYINDVLIPSSGETAIDISTATCLQVNGVLLGGDLNIFRPKEQDGRFISYELNHKKRNKIASIAQGATVVHLYPNFLKKLKITLPCLEEQEKIAGFLSKVDELINECEAEVKDLEEQKKGLLQKIFSQKIRFKDSNNNTYPDWEEKKIGNVCKTFSGGTPSITNNAYYNGDIPFIKSGEIHSSKTEINITEEGLKKSSAKLVTKGDLLFALYGATSGEVDVSQIDGAINQAILCIRSDELNLSFLKNLLSFNKDKILCKYLQGGQGNLSAEIVKSLHFKFPCLAEQDKIAQVLSKMDELIEDKKALLSDWHQFKKGLLQQMFV